MSGSTSIRLLWGNTSALTAISGNVWVDDLDEGESTVVYVEHAGVAEYATPFAPSFDTALGDIEGLLIEPVLSAYVDGVQRKTDGSGFLFRVTVPVGVTGQDHGRGGEASDWQLYWERTGVLANVQA